MARKYREQSFLPKYYLPQASQHNFPSVVGLLILSGLIADSNQDLDVWVWGVAVLSAMFDNMVTMFPSATMDHKFYYPL